MKHWVLLIAKDSVVDGHRFDADPDPTYHFDAYPDPDPYSTLSYTTVENLIFCTSWKSELIEEIRIRIKKLIN